MHSEKLGGNRGNLGTTIGKRLQKLAHNILTFFVFAQSSPDSSTIPPTTLLSPRSHSKRVFGMTKAEIIRRFWGSNVTKRALRALKCSQRGAKTGQLKPPSCRRVWKRMVQITHRSIRKWHRFTKIKSHFQRDLYFSSIERLSLQAEKKKNEQHKIVHIGTVPANRPASAGCR